MNFAIRFTYLRVFMYFKQTTELEKATAKIVFAFVTYQKKEVILANVQ